METRKASRKSADCAGARWKIAGKGFNVLKNSGYNLERKSGCGQKHRHGACRHEYACLRHGYACRDCVEDLWIKARNAPLARRRLLQVIQGYCHLSGLPGLVGFDDSHHLWIPSRKKRRSRDHAVCGGAI